MGMTPRRYDWTTCNVCSDHGNPSVGQNMKDTLNFVGDGDDVDVIHAVERTFGIKLTDAEAVQTRTVGQLSN
jgi:hypothetical protein